MTTSAPSRKKPATTVRSQEAGQLAPRRRLDPRRRRRRRDDLPVLLDAPHRTVQQRLAGRERQQPAAGRLHPRRLQAGPRAADRRGGHRRGRLRRRHQLLAVPAQLRHLRHRHHRRAGLLQRDGRLRLLPAALAGPERGLRPVPGHHDGPADLHRPAQLPDDQEPRPAQHLRRPGPAVPVHDPVRHLLPAPVLPRHVPRGRRGRHARRRQARADLLPDRPARTPRPRSPPWRC